MPEVSTKPYLVRAIYEWCTDSGYRPFIAVVVDERTQVPREFVRNGEIVLNISAEATNRLRIGNELLEFEARFGGVARHVSIPIDNVRAIFAQENGHGMAFEVPVQVRAGSQAQETSAPGDRTGGEDAQAEADGDDEDRVASDERGASEAAPAGDEAEPAASPAGTGRAPGKRSGRASKRAHKTVLRDVSARASDGEESQRSSASPQPAAAPSARRPRKPTIAAVPDDANARRGSGKGQSPSASPDRSASPASPDDDGSGPTTPRPGKPRLTRVK